MKIYIAFISLIVLLLTACSGTSSSDADDHIKKVETPLRIDSRSSFDDEKSKRILKRIGITENGGKIIIDTQKTEDFLEGMAIILDSKVKKIEQKSKELSLSKLGISKYKDKITLDINRSKIFLDSFSKDMLDIANEIKEEIDNTK